MIIMIGILPIVPDAGTSALVSAGILLVAVIAIGIYMWRSGK